MRIKLSDKYQNEREEICNKIITILDLKEEIQKYFACSTISSFKPNFECKRPYLNIIRSILRKQNYNVNGNDIEIKLENNLYKRTMLYKIFKYN